MGRAMPGKQKISALEDHTGYWLRSVSNHVSHAFARKLAAKDTAVAEWVLLRLLYNQEPFAPSLIAEQMGMTKGAITKLVDRLMTKSLVARTASTDDGRAQKISLTEKGRKLVPVLAALADQNDQECFARLSAKDRAALQRILHDLAAQFSITNIPTE